MLGSAWTTSPCKDGARLALSVVNDITQISLDPWQLVELVERRRRRQRPFQRGRPRTPRIVGRLLLAGEGRAHPDEEEQQAQRRDVGANRRYVVPAGEGVRIVGDP